MKRLAIFNYWYWTSTAAMGLFHYFTDDASGHWLKRLFSQYWIDRKGRWSHHEFKLCIFRLSFSIYRSIESWKCRLHRSRCRMFLIQNSLRQVERNTMIYNAKSVTRNEARESRDYCARIDSQDTSWQKHIVGSEERNDSMRSTRFFGSIVGIPGLSILIVGNRVNDATIGVERGKLLEWNSTRRIFVILENPRGFEDGLRNCPSSVLNLHFVWFLVITLPVISFPWCCDKYFNGPRSCLFSCGFGKKELIFQRLTKLLMPFHFQHNDI